MSVDEISRLRADATNVAPLVDLFRHDAGRSALLTRDACGLHADFSRQLVDRVFLDDLMAFAARRDIDARVKAMFAGDVLNATEHRAVMHVALRDAKGSSPEAKAASVQLERAKKLAQDVRSSRVIDVVVNIGIGGSDLGPAMAVRALRRFCDGPEVRFISNIDPADFDSVTNDLDPARTLFIVSSKTFTTLETMHNAERAREWVQSSGVDWQTRFVAATANAAQASAWGITADNCLEFYEWVGGRFSMSSVIGFPLMCAIGADPFQQFLDGMHAMDEHVRTSDSSASLPLLHALVWFANAVAHEMPTVAVIPYSHDLGRLPAYLQQLVMESNGKSVQVSGDELRTVSSPVVWGEPGTNGQHAFFQMLHQGTQVVPVEFIGTVAPSGNDSVAHDLLISNMIAQSEALAVGRSHDDAHRRFAGNRPSTVIMLDTLDPRHLGALVAMYEHSTAIQGWLLGINSFDQFGVELGKELATHASKAIARGAADDTEILTHSLLEWFLHARDSHKNN